MRHNVLLWRRNHWRISSNFSLEVTICCKKWQTCQQVQLVFLQFCRKNSRNFAKNSKNYTKNLSYFGKKLKRLKKKLKGMRPCWAYWASKKCTKNKPDVEALLRCIFNFTIYRRCLLIAKTIKIKMKFLRSRHLKQQRSCLLRRPGLQRAKSHGFKLISNTVCNLSKLRYGLNGIITVQLWSYRQ